MPGPNAPYTKLDYGQVIQQSFDESTDRLRVDATVTASIGEVTITDGVNTMAVNGDGSINVVLAAPVTVNIDAASGDNIMVVGTENATTGGVQHVIKVDASGIQSTYSMNNLVTVRFDTILASYPTTTQEIYLYKNGGSTVATVTVDYVDATKAELISVVRT